MNNDLRENAERGLFSSKLGYVLATAGSAVGLGNIWRFPYLAARYGGGIFLLVYLLLALTFGYTLMMSESALGRMTEKSPVGAFSAFSKKGIVKAGGWINAVIPMLILPYYSVIGGWVCKYLFEYITGNVHGTAQDDFFTGFITSAGDAELWFIVFAALTLIVIVLGVENGVEKVSKFMMPILVLLAILVAIYSMTRPGAGAGIKYFLVPDFKHFSWMTVVSAMGQMFYSLSIAMGILITFGSYMKKDISIEKATVRVEIADTAVAVLAGLMVIPAVFAYSGGDESVLHSGPALMFMTIPKVLAGMEASNLFGSLFFALVLFAALTSAIALAESVASTMEDQFGWGRQKATVVSLLIMLPLGTLSCLGFGPLAGVRVFGMQILDFFDFLTNSVMMPVAALITCVYLTRAVGIGAVEDEIMAGGAPFRRRALFRFMIRYVCPVFVLLILLSSVAEVMGWIKY